MQSVRTSGGNPAEVRRAPVRGLGFVPVTPTPALDADSLWHEDTFAPARGRHCC